MDRSTTTTSSQSYFLISKKYALMAMTMSAFVANTNATNLDNSLSANGNYLSITSSACDIQKMPDATYYLPQKKDYRDRYKRLSKSKWFKNTYQGKSLGEIITIEE